MDVPHLASDAVVSQNYVQVTQVFTNQYYLYLDLR